MLTLMRCLSIFGLLLWTITFSYLLVPILSGFVNFGAPNVYVTLLVVIAGFIVNALLLLRTRTGITSASVGLAITSLLLSSSVIALVVYMVFDLGAR